MGSGILGRCAAPMAVLLALTAVAACAADAPRPNIVFILADDLGYGDLGCYGQQHVPTPRIDRMAAEGLRFTQHYAGSTVCAPSRAALLAGQHTGHLYQRANGDVAFRPDPQDICVARLLKNAGYHAALIGKSGLSCRTDNGRHPNEKGFDEFFGFTSHNAAHRQYPQWLWHNGEKEYFQGNHGREGERYAGDMFVAAAVDYINERANRGPFFLHLSMTQPHADLAAPARWREPFLGKFAETPFAGNETYRPEAHPKATFAGMIAHLDDAVGQVLDALQAAGVAENTIVFFSSDNGAMSEGGWSRDYFGSSGRLRGGKRDLYEGGVRVPLVVRWPRHVPAGRATDHVSAFWDFVPTACELAGIAAPSDVDGISYTATLRGDDAQQRAHEYLYWEFYEQGGKQAVRAGDWKAIRFNVLGDGQRPVELYDLASDLGEARDVAAEHPDVVAHLQDLMRRSHTPSGEYRIE